MGNCKSNASENASDPTPPPLDQEQDIEDSKKPDEAVTDNQKAEDLEEKGIAEDESDEEDVGVDIGDDDEVSNAVESRLREAEKCIGKLEKKLKEAERQEGALKEELAAKGVELDRVKAELEDMNLRSSVIEEMLASVTSEKEDLERLNAQNKAYIDAMKWEVVKARTLGSPASRRSSSTASTSGPEGTAGKVGRRVTVAGSEQNMKSPLSLSAPQALSPVQNHENNKKERDRELVDAEEGERTQITQESSTLRKETGDQNTLLTSSHEEGREEVLPVSATFLPLAYPLGDQEAVTLSPEEPQEQKEDEADEGRSSKGSTAPSSATYYQPTPDAEGDVELEAKTELAKSQSVDSTAASLIQKGKEEFDHTTQRSGSSLSLLQLESSSLRAETISAADARQDGVGAGEDLRDKTQETTGSTQQRNSQLVGWEEGRPTETAVGKMMMGEIAEDAQVISKEVEERRPTEVHEPVSEEIQSIVTGDELEKGSKVSARERRPKLIEFEDDRDDLTSNGSNPKTSSKTVVMVCEDL